MLVPRVDRPAQQCPVVWARQPRIWSGGALVLLCLMALLCSGCPTLVPLQPLPERLEVPQGQRRLKDLLLRALWPQILDVEVNADFVIYRYRQASTIFAPVSENRLALLNIGRVEVFSNNLVRLWTPSNLLLGQIIFGNYQDPQACAALLLFLRDHRAHRG